MKTAKQTVITNKVAMERKGKALDKMRDEFSRAKMAILTDYRGDNQGLNVKDITQLRKRLRDVKAEYFVVKNTLARKVANEMGITGLDTHFNNPTAIVFAYQDPVLATKALVDFVKEKKSPKNEAGLPLIKAGYMDGEILDLTKIQALANLPSREAIYGNLLGMLIAPTQAVMALINEPGRRMATLLDQYSKKEPVADAAGEANTEPVADAAGEAKTEETGAAEVAAA